MPEINNGDSILKRISTLLLRPLVGLTSSIACCFITSAAEMSNLIKREFTTSHAISFRAGSPDKDVNIDLNGDILHQETSAKLGASELQIVCVGLLTVVFTTLQSWIHFEVDVDMEAYFMLQTAQSIIIFMFMYFFLNARGRSKTGIFRTILPSWRANWPILVLHTLSVAISGNDFKQELRNGSGTEFYQLFLALTIPAVILWMQHSSSQSTKSIASNLLIISACVKLLVLSRGHSFVSPVTTSLSSLLLSIIYGCYLVSLHAYLKKDHLLSLLQLLISFQIPMCFVLGLLHSEPNAIGELLKESKLKVMRQATMFLSMASLALLKMVFSFLLLKISTPLTCIVTLNLTSIPLTLIRVFVYKLVFLVASFKTLFLFALDVIIITANGKAERTFERCN